MAITLRQKIAPSWYTPESEKGEASPTRFRVRPLDGVERLECYEHLSFNKAGQAYLNATGVAFCAARGVIGWENAPEKNDDGSDKPLTQPALRQLEPLLIRELGLHVWHITELGADAEKNS